MDVGHIKQSHLSAFDWKNGRIPLAIKVEDMSGYDGIRYDDKDFYRRLFDRQLENIRQSIEIGSDIIPTLSICNYGTGIVPSLLGADISLADTNFPVAMMLGFNVRPVIADLKSLEKYHIDPNNRFFSRVIQHFNYYVENVPEGVWVCGSPEDPFDAAHILRGNDLFLDMYDNPEGVHELMDLMTQLVIQTEKELRTIAGHFSHGKIRQCPSLDGLWFDGFRIAGDSLVMLSESMIKEFVRPYYEKLAQAFGCRLYIHFCSIAPMAGEQILNAFLDCGAVAGLSTQFGLELFEKRYDDLQNQLMFDTGYEGAHSYYVDKFGGIRGWAQHLKDRFGCCSGLIVNTRVASKEEGQRLWDSWNDIWS